MAEVLLLPSLFESYGLPIVEAMASGCPVLTADRYGTKEIAGDAALLVNPESVDEIAAGMHRLRHEPDLRASYDRRARERVRPLTWARCAEQTLAGAGECRDGAAAQALIATLGFFDHIRALMFDGVAQPRNALVDVHDFVLTDLHHVSVVQIVPTYALGLHINAVGTVEIFDEARVGMRNDVTVMPTDELAVDLQIIIRGPANHQAARLQFALHQGPAGT